MYKWQYLSVTQDRDKPYGVKIDHVHESVKVYMDKEHCILRALQLDPSKGNVRLMLIIVSTIEQSQPMSTCSDRFNTFESWPATIALTPRKLVEAGFYYTGLSDQVVCFSCDLRLSKWQCGDDPYVKHFRLSPNCNYLRKEYGSDKSVEV